MCCCVFFLYIQSLKKKSLTAFFEANKEENTGRTFYIGVSLFVVLKPYTAIHALTFCVFLVCTFVIDFVVLIEALNTFFFLLFY